MGKDNPSKTWVLTINEQDDGWLPKEEELIQFFSEECEDYAFQLESGDVTNRQHYQCCLRLKRRKRKQTLLKGTENFFKDKLPCFRYERMYGTFAESVEYCVKSDTRIGHPVSTLPIYEGADIAFLDDASRRYSWQNDLFKELFISGSLYFKTPDDRKIHWITDRRGCSGKSKFTKHLAIRTSSCIKVPFGTATQMRSAVIAAGPKSCYIIDIPRTLGREDDMHAVLSLIEDLKNGFVVSAMYGKNHTLMMAPPHVIIFSNDDCPMGSLSQDRWIWRSIHNEQFKQGNYIPGPLETLGE